MSKMLTCSICYKTNRRENFSKEGWQHTDNIRFPNTLCPSCVEWVRKNWRFVCLMCPPNSTFDDAAAMNIREVQALDEYSHA